MSEEKSNSLGWAFSAAVAAIWTTAAASKIFYTDRTARLIEKKGWPPAPDMQHLPVGTRMSDLDPKRLLNSSNMHYALWGTGVSGVMFLLLAKT